MIRLLVCNILPLNTTVLQTYGRTEQYICCIS